MSSLDSHIAYSQFSHIPGNDNISFVKSLGNSVNDYEFAFNDIKTKKKSTKSSSIIQHDDETFGEMNAVCSRPDCREALRQLKGSSVSILTEKADLEKKETVVRLKLELCQQKLAEAEDGMKREESKSNSLNQQLVDMRRQQVDIQQTVRQQVEERERLSNKVAMLESERQKWLVQASDIAKSYKQALWHPSSYFQSSTSNQLQNFNSSDSKLELIWSDNKDDDDYGCNEMSNLFSPKQVPLTPAFLLPPFKPSGPQEALKAASKMRRRRRGEGLPTCNIISRPQTTMLTPLKLDLTDTTGPWSTADMDSLFAFDFPLNDDCNKNTAQRQAITSQLGNGITLISSGKKKFVGGRISSHVVVLNQSNSLKCFQTKGLEC